MKKVLVTGGLGFIGSNLVRTLVDEGTEVHVLDILAEPPLASRVVDKAHYHQGDIRDGEVLRTLLQGVSHVFHLAALPRVQYSLENPEETHTVNVNGTLALLVAARDAQVERLVYSSSGSVYGDQEQMPFTEDMLPNPMSPYALHKYMGEQYCRHFSEVYGLPTVSLRYFNVYGPHADPQGPYALVVSRFIEQRRSGQPLTIRGDGTNSRDYTHVRDVVAANLRAATAPTVGRGEVLNIGGGRAISVREVASCVGGETLMVDACVEPRHALSDTMRARTLLGWEPTVVFEDGVAELKRAAGLV